jgi:putative MATE family efflux protein
MKKTEQLRTQHISRLLFSLSAPAIISLLTNSVNMAIDRLFIARGVGTLALSAVTIAFGLYLVMQACSQLISTGASSAVAIQLGKEEQGKAEKILGNSFTLSIFLAIVISIIGTLCLDPLLKLYGADTENIAYAREFAGIMFLGAICFILAQSMNSLIRGMGYAKRSLINFLCSIVINLILDALFIFVFKWGVRGSALATVIGNLVCAVLAIQFLYSKNNLVRLRIQNIRLDKEIIHNILSIGISGFIGQFALSLVTLVFNRVCRNYGGNTAVASYGIISTLFMLVYMPLIGLGQGIQPIIGYNFGAKNYGRVKETLLNAFQYGTLFCIILFILFEVFSPQIVAVFGGHDNNELALAATTGMRIYGAMLPVVAIQMIGANFFQYIGKVKKSMFLSSLRQMLLLIPLVIILPLFFNMTGVWIATPISDFVSFSITFFLVYREIMLLNILISSSDIMKI